MIKMLEILLIFFVIAAGVLVFYVYYPIIIKKLHRHKDKEEINEKKEISEKEEINDKEEIIKANLNILKNESDVEKITSAFVNLIKVSYVLIHVMVNKGNNYKDDVQCIMFCDLLNSPEIVEKIKSLEDNNGQYTL